jgi:hypothetical protein
MAGAIAQDRESCQFPFVLDEKPTLLPVGSTRKRSVSAREVPDRTAHSNSERAGPSACVGKRVSAIRLTRIDRLDELGRAAGRGSAGPDG